MVRETVVGERTSGLKRRLARTVFSLALVIGAVFAVRWTVRAAMSHAYRAERTVGEVEMPVVAARRVYPLGKIVPEDLRINLAGLAVSRRVERLGMPYSLAVDVADEKSKSAGWERLDNENAATLKNLSGMERVYRTPEGTVVLREVRALKGDDSIMEDLVVPVEMIPKEDEHTTPDVLARRSAAHLKDLMPPVLRDVVVGSPLFTELIERNGGAAFIVRCLSETSVASTSRLIESAARKAGWREARFADVPGARQPSAAVARGGAIPPMASWTKENLSFHFAVAPRAEGGGCDVDYRFADDETFIPNERKNK